MAYPSLSDNGFCPESHPHRFISIFYEVQWETNAFADMWYGDEQPFVWSFGDPTGFGYHGDFVSGWDVPTLQDAVTNCNDLSGVIQDCPVFDNLYFTADQNNGCLIPPTVDEQVFGNLTALPGCNSIQAGPGLAVEESDCGAVDVIGKAENPFVNLVQSRGFSYLGCGTDVAFGADRTLTGTSVTLSNLTVESCVAYCEAAGFSIAGMEYGNQCYCGDSLTSGRAPVDGLMGACTMPCAGDASENCGGAAYISLYQKCTGDDACENISYILNTAVGPQPTGVSTVSGVVAPPAASSVAASITASGASSVATEGSPSVAVSATVSGASSVAAEASSSAAAVTDIAEASPTTPAPDSTPTVSNDSESTSFSTETLPSATSLATVFLTSTKFVNPVAASPTSNNTIAASSLASFPSDVAKAASTPDATGCDAAGNPPTVTVTVAMSTVTVEVPAPTSGGDTGSGSGATDPSPSLAPFPMPGNGTVAAVGTGTAPGTAVRGTGTAVSGVFPTGDTRIKRHGGHLRRHMRENFY